MLPALPLVTVFAGHGLSLLAPQRPAAEVFPEKVAKHPKPRSQSCSGIGRLAWMGLLLLNAPLALYFGLWHQAGPISAIWHLAQEAEAASLMEGGPAIRAIFLMPCHSTPFHASLHPHQIEMDFLDCSPPPPETAGPEIPVDETTRFYQNPALVAEQLLVPWGPPGVPPREYTHVFMFDSMAQTLAALLREKGYIEQARFFHSHPALQSDDRQSSYLVVFTRPKDVAGQHYIKTKVEEEFSAMRQFEL